MSENVKLLQCLAQYSHWTTHSEKLATGLLLLTLAKPRSTYHIHHGVQRDLTLLCSLEVSVRPWLRSSGDLVWSCWPLSTCACPSGSHLCVCLSSLQFLPDFHFFLPAALLARMAGAANLYRVQALTPSSFRKKRILDLEKWEESGETWIERLPERKRKERKKKKETIQREVNHPPLQGRVEKKDTEVYPCTAALKGFGLWRKRKW